MSTKKLKVGVLGATGMVGQRFVSLLDGSPVVRGDAGRREPELGGQALRARRSPGAGRCERPMPAAVGDAGRARTPPTSRRSPTQVDFVFCAVDMPKDATAQARGGLRARRDAGRLEQLGAPLDARRADDDPGDQPGARRRHRGPAPPARHQARLRRGEAELLDPELRAGDPPAARVRPDSAWRSAPTRRSPAPARPSRRWPEMVDNVIPFIKGEEEKSEQEPLKIWGAVADGAHRPRDAARSSPRSASACR